MNLADLLFGTYRRDVLALLYTHLTESYHVREIARLTQRPANTLYRELALLAEAGVLLRRPIGNQVHYQANPACPIYEELRGILRKTAGIGDVLREALTGLTDRVRVAFVYGSIASGEERARSDVDVLIVGDVKFEEAVNALHPAQEKLRREINPHVYWSEEFARALSEKQAFLERVLVGPKIFLIGDADELGRLVGDRTAEAA